jgi:hypothetical protein
LQGVGLTAPNSQKDPAGQLVQFPGSNIAGLLLYVPSLHFSSIELVGQ